MNYRGQKRRYTPEYARKAWEKVPLSEKSAIARVACAAASGQREYTRSAMNDYAVTRYRHSGRAQRDLAGDRRRRRLVGAHLPIETAEMVRIAAADTGRSIYRFVSDAIDAEIARTNWDGHLFNSK